MSEFCFDDLQYATPRRGESFRLYIYDETGMYRGGQWFRRAVRYPLEEIPVFHARMRAEAALKRGQEIRITDGGDLLVFHAKDGVQLYPPNQTWKEFWESL